MKMVWRVSPSHKRLQVRMEHMRRFRHQHEQLRTVIVRVLRPSTTMHVMVGQDGIAPDELTRTPDPLSLEAADASAIEVCILNRYVFLKIYS